MPIPKTMTPVACAALIAAAVTAFSASAQSDDQIEHGRVIYEETAGGVGCAMCHGMAATGDPDAGAPYIRGVSDAQLRSALTGAVPVMEFITLTTEEESAVLAYLQYLVRSESTELDPIAAAGRLLFEETAGGVGCVACHGDRGQGDIGPDIRGQDSVVILDQLRTNEQMEFIQLSPDEVDQIAAYLRHLHDMEAH